MKPIRTFYVLLETLEDGQFSSKIVFETMDGGKDIMSLPEKFPTKDAAAAHANQFIASAFEDLKREAEEFEKNGLH